MSTFSVSQALVQRIALEGGPFFELFVNSLRGVSEEAEASSQEDEENSVEDTSDNQANVVEGEGESSDDDGSEQPDDTEIDTDISIETSGDESAADDSEDESEAENTDAPGLYDDDDGEFVFNSPSDSFDETDGDAQSAPGPIDEEKLFDLLQSLAKHLLAGLGDTDTLFEQIEEMIAAARDGSSSDEPENTDLPGLELSVEETMLAEFPFGDMQDDFDFVPAGQEGATSDFTDFWSEFDSDLAGRLLSADGDAWF